MAEAAEFTDFNFKLAVVQRLMYEQGALMAAMRSAGSSTPSGMAKMTSSTSSPLRMPPCCPIGSLSRRSMTTNGFSKTSGSGELRRNGSRGVGWKESKNGHPGSMAGG